MSEYTPTPPGHQPHSSWTEAENISREAGTVRDEALRLIIVEDENLLRDLLRTTLSRMPRFAVTGSYANGVKAHEDFEQARPDVALLDIELGKGWTGVETGLRLRDLNPDIGLVLLSNHASPDLLKTIPDDQIGGWSYLLKKSVADVPALVRAIEGARNHLVVLDPHLLEIAFKRARGPKHPLSERQVEILALVSQGYTNAAIAKKLFLSEKSIENQLTGIYSALELASSNPHEHTRVRAVLAFLDEAYTQ